MNNIEWKVKIRDANKFREPSEPDLSNFTFPATDEIGIEGDEDHVTLTLKKNGFVKSKNNGEFSYVNMQHNAAAFEAWALALLCHCNVRHIEITLDPKVEHASSGHFERFYYRLQLFASLFAEVDIKTIPIKSRASNGAFLNQPGRQSPIDQEHAWDELASKHSESNLEKALQVSNAFRKHFALSSVVRQWPVGLFKGKVKAGNEIFTGRKSAIDLVGISGKTLVLFELKTGTNRSAGIISELLFYSSVMRDALRGNFKFEKPSSDNGLEISPRMICDCTEIRAIFLAEKMHPLVNQVIVSRLNAALSASSERPLIQIESVTIKSNPNVTDDFTFA